MVDNEYSTDDLKVSKNYWHNNENSEMLKFVSGHLKTKKIV